jgi:phosphoserine phosphatase
VAIISNSIDILVDEVGRDLHIPYAIANNHFIFDDRGQLREIAVSDNDIHFKWKELQQLCKKLFIKPDDCFYIGDGEDDREIFLHIKHGITFRDSSVAPIAWKTIDNFINLKTIL